MATLIGWRTIDAIPSTAREVACQGDEASTILGVRHYYVERSASGWWLYRWEISRGTAAVIRCRELDPSAPQLTADGMWISAY